jgi:hypothetical protein
VIRKKYLFISIIQKVVEFDPERNEPLKYTLATNTIPEPSYSYYYACGRIRTGGEPLS